ncbi:TIGR03986 family CRISPR-associated RAMP protein [Scytonema sp. UIC 10036]|uniref:TIGR03986 family type III CRISPR-associated RAMP protein n=1 Tax=Scytonema sp. UIC 10036 TaxID=2304196 RepID=UPI0012DA3E1F|nr:TIGR03986 family CRISPR-associated RAMP protein [Scytonema sp. UIC 10036]MUG95758.1 TIGR03986 family CRISPR-associated RAMP protein [Scytonema sp. UIC 10036]
MAVIRGKLVVIPTKNKNDSGLRIVFTTKKGLSVRTQIPLGQLHSELVTQSLDQLSGLEVDLELENGQPRRIRPVNQLWHNSLNTSDTVEGFRQTTEVIQQRSSQKNLQPKKVIQPSPATQKARNSSASGDFHNPYNFIPALPRHHLQKFQEDNPGWELGDRNPSGHESYQDKLWSGKISVTLTTVTPLLIPDAANLKELTEGEKKGHKIYRVRLDPRYLDRQGKPYKPYLPPTSIKGMLRSAYEAVTNSRLSVFGKHENRLAYRMPAKIGLQMVPARIEKEKIYLYPGSSCIGNDGTPQGEMYAAWLPRYNCHDADFSKCAVKYQQGQLPQHGQSVTAWLEKYKKIDRQGNVIFTYWRVRKIAPVGQNLGNPPCSGQRNGRHEPISEDMIQVNGYVCITNKNIDNKHDERLFFCYQQAPVEKELTPDLHRKWNELIINYQEIHQDEIAKGMQGPPALSFSKWSRHITGGYTEHNLSNGTLCYAHVRNNKSQLEILGLYPVIIARQLFAVAPLSLFSEELKPAKQINQLSPADRVFGWVSQEGNGSYKGQLRINAVKCESDKAIQNFDQDPFPNGLPLAILGEPKPEQARFYIAKNQDGEPLPDGTKKVEAYQEKQGLRGRKVYPHHQLPSEYWNTDSDTIKIGDRYREYLRLGKKQDNQNRTIQGWVKPGTKFCFEIDVINLSDIELGALFWLLQLTDKNPEYFHRLGSAKPLGFGSVELKIEQTDLRTGQQWHEFYYSLTEVIKPEQSEVRNCIKEFQKAVEYAYDAPFTKVSFIAAFLQAARGFKKPIHYPRTTENPNTEGNSYEWFVANENDTKTDKALKLSLPPLTKDLGLPLLPRISKNEQKKSSER